MKSAMVVLFLVLAGCFSAEAALTKQRARASEDATLRGSASMAVDAGDEAESPTDKDSGDDDASEEDDDDDEKTVSPQEAKLQKELAANLHEQSQLKEEVKKFSDQADSDREIAASVSLVANETESPAMGHMLGQMWKEMRMFETPMYTERMEEKMKDLKKEQKDLELKLAKDKNPTAEEITAASSALLHGSEDCRCIGIDELKGETLVALKRKGKGEGNVSYPADLGARCEAWDAEAHPKCPGESWCEQKWCYVDPCKCKSVADLPKPSTYLPDAKYQGKPLHFSYATCGGKDSYSTEEEKKTAKDIEETCAVEVDAAKWGAENCRCVGIGPQPGTTKVSIKDKLVKFPADVGASCAAWEADNHPECSGDEPPSWCSQSWCYVDPCSCGLETPPKTSSYVPEANYQGKPVYYSYATCGGKDSYTSGRKEACVNQKTSGDCGKLPKCSWTGEECLGKELVELCAADAGKPASAKSAAWTHKALVAVALPLLSLVY